jgi:orotidine-5'-phosphate decarboxylase
VQKLDAACQANHSLLCVGLDPDPRLMPTADIIAFNRAIIDATRDLVCAYKPNGAFYEAFGFRGVQALAWTVRYIRRECPDVIIIGDAKRGDVPSSSSLYAEAMFLRLRLDAVTVNGYLGRDSVEPFLKYDGKGAFVLCRTSNPGAVEFQDIQDKYGVPLYQSVARTVGGWSTDGNLGLVVGATYPEELGAVREICPSLPILIPGVGSQNGDLRAAVVNGTDASGRRAIINASRSIIYAGSGPGFAGAARRAASDLRDKINAILESEGLGWS